jgi:hypothetical protein
MASEKRVTRNTPRIPETMARSQTSQAEPERDPQSSTLEEHDETTEEDTADNTLTKLRALKAENEKLLEVARLRREIAAQFDELATANERSPSESEDEGDKNNRATVEPTPGNLSRNLPIVPIHGPPMGYQPSLPKPRAPPIFNGASRREHTNWVRGCEDHLDNPYLFPTEAPKVRFALQYLGSDQRDVWDRYVNSIDPIQPSWAGMKKRMLETLGTSQEREQKALAEIKDFHQGKKNPTEALNWLKLRWDDLPPPANLTRDEIDRDSRRINDYFLSLNEDLQTQLQLVPRVYTSLTDLEQQANINYRHLKTQSRRKTSDRAQSTNKGTK